MTVKKTPYEKGFTLRKQQGRPSLFNSEDVGRLNSAILAGANYAKLKQQYSLSNGTLNGYKKRGLLLPSRIKASEKVLEKINSLRESGLSWEKIARHPEVNLSYPYIQNLKQMGKIKDTKPKDAKLKQSTSTQVKPLVPADSLFTLGQS